jgi:uncharacterized protein YeaO (DUF488 family)
VIHEPAIKRVYDPPAESDGMRILVDRLWPRGLTKEKAKVDLWLKDISPSNELRKEFHGQEDDWEEFRKAYFAELKSDTAQAAAKVLFEHLRAGHVTLLYGARDEQHNNAVALLAWISGTRSRHLSSPGLTGQARR